MSAFCFSGMLAIRAASSSISCCSLYENTIADSSLLLSSLLPDSDFDLVELISFFGTGEICVNESFDESADEVGGVLDMLVALNGCSFVRVRRKNVFLQFIQIVSLLDECKF